MKLFAVGMTVVLLAVPAALAGDTLDDTYQSLQDAVAKKDAAQVKKLVADLNPLIREAESVPAPAADEDKQAWTARMAYVKSIGEYSDYALFAVAIQSPPAETVDLIATLERQNPKSKFLDQAYDRYLLALTQTGAAAKIPAIVDKALVNFPDNEDLLYSAMESALSRKQSDRALAYANRLTAALQKRAKPESLSAEDWERKRDAAMGRADWVAGIIYCEKGTYAAGDKKLRAALPFVKGNNAMMGPALYYLGVANYQLGKMTLSKAQMLEAVKFSQQAAAIPGAYADQARHNALVIQEEAGRMR